MPNTRVNFFSGLFGGLVGAFFWEGAQILLAWAHAKASYYNAIYGVVYHLLFFTLWLYWSWLIVLFGNEVTYARQNLRQLTAQSRLPAVVRDPVDEYMALAALVAISDRFLHREAPMSLQDLGRRSAAGISWRPRSWPRSRTWTWSMKSPRLSRTPPPAMSRPCPWMK